MRPQLKKQTSTIKMSEINVVSDIKIYIFDLVITPKGVGL
jgi:hypothetical protein